MAAKRQEEAANIIEPINVFLRPNLSVEYMQKKEPGISMRPGTKDII